MINFEALKRKAKELKLNIYAIYLASRDPRVSWFAKILAICVVAYAFSPIDLIPDFIPILGYLDDVILLPIGIIVVLKLIPSDIIEEHKQKADELIKNGKPTNWVVGGLIVLLWISFTLLVAQALINKL